MRDIKKELPLWHKNEKATDSTEWKKKASTHFFTDEFQWSLTSLGAGVDGVPLEQTSNVQGKLNWSDDKEQRRERDVFASKGNFKLKAAATATAQISLAESH